MTKPEYDNLHASFDDMIKDMKKPEISFVLNIPKTPIQNLTVENLKAKGRSDYFSVEKDVSTKEKLNSINKFIKIYDEQKEAKLIPFKLKSHGLIFKVIESYNKYSKSKNKCPKKLILAVKRYVQADKELDKFIKDYDAKREFLRKSGQPLLEKINNEWWDKSMKEMDEEIQKTNELEKNDLS